MNGRVVGFQQLVQKLGHSKKQVTPFEHFYSSRDTKLMVILWVFINWFKVRTHSKTETIITKHFYSSRDTK